MSDPYIHHPELRGRITPPDQSRFRDLDLAMVDAVMAEAGRGPDWRYTHAEREARRQAMLALRPGPDLWVFAYGSLMWDPGFHYAEVRVGHLAGYARRFCLLDTFGARGTRERPGLQAGLDAVPGGTCTGLVFRIAAEAVQHESEIVWRREAMADTYLPRLMPVDTAEGRVQALAFVANPASADIARDLPHDVVVRYLATGEGMFGTSREYMENVAAQLGRLGLQDAELSALVADVRSFAA